MTPRFLVLSYIIIMQPLINVHANAPRRRTVLCTAVIHPYIRPDVSGNFAILSGL
jgi:hypothetical protein